MGHLQFSPLRFLFSRSKDVDDGDSDDDLDVEFKGVEAAVADVMTGPIDAPIVLRECVPVSFPAIFCVSRPHRCS